ncbi:MerR family transcriptional regulator [Melioribacteraceae bacterium 4301-Me]|uniref:MerR family transcriptional regulator n=1 Tax=Pyranulibacter aquaticus TaxID=3163344 RepID=UPI00359A1220
MNLNFSEDMPVYSIGTAAKLLNVSVHTLRMYEREGLFIPFKKDSSQRLFSKKDLERISCIRQAINESKISINGIKAIYSLIPCWEVKKCSKTGRKNCLAFVEHSKPCWTYKHKANDCEGNSCRDCDVYTNYSQCKNIKELLKSMVRK